MVAERELRQIELIGVLEPRALERARRVAYAIHLLREGRNVLEVRMAIRAQYGLSQSRAWRVVDMAIDLAGPV